MSSDLTPKFTVIADATFLIYATKTGFLDAVLENWELVTVENVMDECCAGYERYVDAHILKEKRNEKCLKVLAVPVAPEVRSMRLGKGDKELLSYVLKKRDTIRKEKNLIIAVDDKVLQRHMKNVLRADAKFKKIGQIRFLPDMVYLAYLSKLVTKETAVSILNKLLGTAYTRKQRARIILDEISK